MSISRSIIATLFCLVVYSLPWAVAQRPVSLTGATRITSADEVIERWQPDRHLFVKGNIGVSEKLLDELETWLDANGQNWTIVLMENAADEVSIQNGQKYFGVDAVLQALSKGLNNRTDFGKLKHSKTGEAHGCIFTLFLKQREFNYYGSDAQNRRGLGMESWKGKLDQPARRAMMGGGRVIDAVKDTVRSINEQLERMIANEAADAERVEREARRAVANCQSAIEHSRQLVDTVKLAAAKLRDKFPQAQGALANPPLDAWRSKLDALAEELTANSVRESQLKLNAIDEEIQTHLNAYAANDGLASNVESIQNQLTTLATAPNNVASSTIKDVKQLIAEAERLMSNGETGVQEMLAKAAASAAEGQAIVKAEVARLDRAAVVQAWIRRTALAMAGLFVFFLAIFLFIMNRRRKPLMEAAFKTLAERERLVAKETEGLDRLFTRNDELLGSKEKIAERGYTGATKEVSEKAINYIDDLFIMSKEVRRVLTEAKELVHPSTFFGKVVNLFSGGRYQQAVNLVTGKPLKFTRLSGLPWVLRDRQPGGGDSAPVTNATPDEITLTFEEVFQAFQVRGKEAENALNTVENSLANVHDQLSIAQSDLEKCAEAEKQLNEQANLDNYFRLPSYIESLLPAIEKDIEEADRLAGFDAVGAVEYQLPIARRKIDEATAIGNVLMEARKNLFPILQQAVKQLSELQFASTWIDAELESLSGRADQLVQAASSQSVRSDIDVLAGDLHALGKRAETTVKLATRIRTELTPEGEALSGRIEKTRGELAKLLDLSESNVLSEIKRVPLDFWRSAGKSLEGAGIAVNMGQNAAAQAAIEAMLADVGTADQILDASIQAAKNFDLTTQNISSNLRRLASRLPQLRSSVDQLRQRFVASTLEIQPESGANPKQSWPLVDDLVQQAANPMSTVDELIKLASTEHRQGRVLRASDILRDAASQLTQSHILLDQTEHHLEQVEAKLRENREEAMRLQAQLESLYANSRDPLVTQDTLDAILIASRQLTATEQALTSSTAAPNPFEIASNLASYKQQLIALETRCAADRQANAEAARAVAGARRQLQMAQQLVRQSQTDNIPDSSLTKQANERIAILAQALVSVESQLRQPHGNWKVVASEASKLQADLSSATNTLNSELQSASQALAIFQQASQSVFQAEQWSGAYGIRVVGSPGVRDLERARTSLQQGNYQGVLELCRIAAAAAITAVQQAEREVERRRLAAEREAEAARRRCEMARRTQSSGGPIVFGGGGFGSGGSFGGGFGGGSVSGSASSSSSGGRSTSASDDTGFGRSGW
jgi:hypothetical protein